MADDAARADWAGIVHARCGDARIASLVPSLTETLFALGLGERVVARTGFCVRPRGDVKRVAKVGGTKDPDLAKLRALAPTHLLVNVDENRREDVDAAREFVRDVVVTHPMEPDDNRRLIRMLGAIFAREETAEMLVQSFERSLELLDRVSRPLPRERVLYVVWRKPWMSVSRETYVSATLARAGWDTLPERCATRYPAIGDDDRAWRDADRILLSTEPFAFRERDVRELAAALRKPVHLVDGEWTSWYGARAADGLRELADFRRSLAAA